MSLTYSTYVNSLVNLAPYPDSTDTTFSTDLPNIIDYAELRCYRDLDLLNTKATGTTSLSTGTRSFTLPSQFTTATFVVDRISVITPSTQTNPDLGTRNGLMPTSESFIDALYPSSSGSTVPQFFAMVTQSTFLAAPWPDATYTVEVVGMLRPLALSSTNTTTLLSVYFPDLFIAASMIRVSALKHNYGAQSDNPQQAMSWEKNYTDLLASAKVEEARKKFTGEGWSSNQPSQIATPPRT